MSGRTIPFAYSSIHITLSWTLSFALLTGCAHDPDRNWSPQSMEELGGIAIVTSGNKPTVRRLSMAKDYTAGMAEGAVSGMLLYASATSQDPNQPPAQSDSPCKTDDGFGSYLGCLAVSAVVGAILSIGAMIVSAGLGALWGAGATATGHGPQPPAAVEAEAALHSATEYPDPQEKLADHLKSLATATLGLQPTVYADKEYVTAYGPEVRSQMNGIATFLFTEIESVELRKTTHHSDQDMNLVVRLLVKTFRGGEVKPSDVHHYEWNGEPHALYNWAEPQSELFRTQLSKAYQELSGQVLARVGKRITPQPVTSSPAP